ncbi:MAG: ABC transporter permease [Pseudomonadota bacterium]
MRINRTTLIFMLLAGVMLCFIIMPLAKLMLSSSFSSLAEALYDHEVTKAIWLTITCALWATLASLIFGIPLAYLLARYDFFGKRILEAIVDLPVVVPHTAAGIALLTVFGQRFLAGKLLSDVGISVVGTQVGIAIAMAFVSAPFLINAAKEAFRMVDPKLENAARTLGATRWQAFRKVCLPASRKAIFSGMIMMWARGISEFGAVIILAYHPMVAPVLIYERFEAYGLAWARPVAVLLLVVSLLVFGLLRAFGERASNRNA